MTSKFRSFCMQFGWFASSAKFHFWPKNTLRTLTYNTTWLALPRSEAQALVCLPVGGAPWSVLLQHCIMLQLFFIVEYHIERFLCAMRVFEVRASSSSPRLPLLPNFVSFAASIAELAHGEKSRTQSLTQLIWCPGNQAFALRNNNRPKITTTVEPPKPHDRDAHINHI